MLRIVMLLSHVQWSCLHISTSTVAVPLPYAPSHGVLEAWMLSGI